MKHKVGDIVTGVWISDAEGKTHSGLAFKILREITREEFLEFWENHPEPKMPVRDDLDIVGYYEILMD